jgi:hypothetical protein
MIEKSTFYSIDGRTATAIRKVLARIKNIDFKGSYGLSDEECLDIQIYLDNVEIEEESK